MRVCVDAGHGGNDPGALGSYNREADVNLAIALLLEHELEDYGFDPIMTRRIDRTLSLKARSDFANRFGAELFVSIHCNAGKPSAQGIETWIFPGSVISRPFASSIQSEIMNTFPNHKDRHIKEANFHVLRETVMPAVLIECEFLTNRRQERFLTTAANQLKLAEAITRGIGFSTQMI